MRGQETIKQVLLIFIVILLLIIQFETLLNSVFNMLEIFERLLPWMKMVVSSAKSKNLSILLLRTMSLIYIRKSTGPRIDP